MAKTIIALASDHAAIQLKAMLTAHLAALGYEVLDLGTHDNASVDYPDYANALALAIIEGKAQKGILMCGSGIGMSIAANRHKEIRAALCADGLSAELSRRHNDANVLVLGARLIGEEVAKECVTRFLKTEFEGGRHQKRVEKMS